MLNLDDLLKTLDGKRARNTSELSQEAILQLMLFKEDHEAAIAEKDARIDELIKWHERKDNRMDALESADKDHKELNRKLANRNADLTEKLTTLESANAGLTEVLKYIGTGLDPRTAHYSEVFGDEVVKPFNNMRSMSEYAFESLAKLAKGEK